MAPSIWPTDLRPTRPRAAPQTLQRTQRGGWQAVGCLPGPGLIVRLVGVAAVGARTPAMRSLCRWGGALRR
jgi:hypothetical protein